MRTLNRCTLLALAAGALAAQSLDAQDTTAARPQTHTVVRGDNLWDLSQRYLGNPFLWPEIYRLNRDVVEDPHWIYPGEVLRLPGDTTPAVAQLPSAQVPVPPTPTVPEQRPPREQTIFSPRRPAPVETAPTTPAPRLGVPPGVVGAEPNPTVRPGEVMVAPFVDREGGPRGFGRILKSGDLDGVAKASDRTHFQAFDRVFIAPPVGHVAPEGEKYLTYKLGPLLENQGQVMIPTGVVEVTRAARTGVAAVAKVVRSFGEVSTTDRLIPIDTAGAGSTVRPNRVADGPVTRIKWVYGEPVLPNVQNFVVLEVSARNGVRMGDEFLIYKPREKQEEGQLDDPEIPIAKLQVVRATQYGATAVIVGQGQPAIQEGMWARIVARMP